MKVQDTFYRTHHISTWAMWSVTVVFSRSCGCYIDFCLPAPPPLSGADKIPCAVGIAGQAQEPGPQQQAFQFPPPEAQFPYSYTPRMGPNHDPRMKGSFTQVGHFVRQFLPLLHTALYIACLCIGKCSAS